MPVAFHIALAIACAVASNLLLKTGAAQAGIGTVWPLTVINLRVLLAALSYGIAFFAYAMTLRQMPLSLAQAVLSLQYVFIILAAAFVLGEAISASQWVGIGLIAAGLLVLGL